MTQRWLKLLSHIEHACLLQTYLWYDPLGATWPPGLAAISVKQSRRVAAGIDGSRNLIKGCKFPIPFLLGPFLIFPHFSRPLTQLVGLWSRCELPARYTARSVLAYLEPGNASSGTDLGSFLCFMPRDFSSSNINFSHCWAAHRSTDSEWGGFRVRLHVIWVVTTT